MSLTAASNGYDSGEFLLSLLCVMYKEDSMRVVLGSLLLNSVADYGESWLTIVNDSGEFLRSLLCVSYEEDRMQLVLCSLLLTVSLTTASHG
jgi:hypothetical protein